MNTNLSASNQAELTACGNYPHGLETILY